MRKEEKKIPVLVMPVRLTKPDEDHLCFLIWGVCGTPDDITYDNRCIRQVCFWVPQTCLYKSANFQMVQQNKILATIYIKTNFTGKIKNFLALQLRSSSNISNAKSSSNSGVVLEETGSDGGDESLDDFSGICAFKLVWLGDGPREDFDDF